MKRLVVRRDTPIGWSITNGRFELVFISNVGASANGTYVTNSNQARNGKYLNFALKRRYHNGITKFKSGHSEIGRL